MSILKTILQAQDGDLVSKLADNFGVDASSAAKAIGGMTPALANGLKQNLGSSNALSAILGAATSGGFDKYLDSSGDLLSGGLGDGANILGSLLGGESGIESVATKGAEASGIDASTVAAMLPAVASMVMGAVTKQTAGDGGIEGLLSGGGLGQLTSFLDADGDGSVTDDLMDMAKKFF